MTYTQEINTDFVEDYLKDTRILEIRSDMKEFLDDSVVIKFYKNDKIGLYVMGYDGEEGCWVCYFEHEEIRYINNEKYNEEIDDIKFLFNFV